jgi:twitching motility protein PilI
MNLSALTVQSSRPQRMVGDAYIRFHLVPKTQAVLAMQQVQEVISLPAQRLTPMPNMPACILGLMNRRSRAIWVVDLAQVLGIPGFDANRNQYDVILVQVDTIALAFAVQQIDSITWLAANTIQPAPNHVPTNVQAFLKGCVLQAAELWLVLDAAAIVHAPLLRRSAVS